MGTSLAITLIGDFEQALINLKILSHKNHAASTRKRIEKQCREARDRLFMHLSGQAVITDDERTAMDKATGL